MRQGRRRAGKGETSLREHAHTHTLLSKNTCILLYILKTTIGRKNLEGGDIERLSVFGWSTEQSCALEFDPLTQYVFLLGACDLFVRL